jgi:rhodanese-related sulfurtransferase
MTTDAAAGPTLTSADLCALMQSDGPHAVLDLRERAAYERGHIFGTTTLPRRLIESRLLELVTAPATPIALVDEDGALADLAGPTLRGMGYTDVRTLAGGVAGWRREGRPLVQGLNVPSKVFGEQVLHDAKTPEVSPRELAERIARGDDMVIVDARTPEEYARGCLPGAWSVPGGELVLRIAELVPRPDTTIVVHCGGRTRSYVGAESVRRMHLPNPVVAVQNGTMGWELAGLELERGAARWAPPASPEGLARAIEVARRVAGEAGVRFIAPADLTALWARRDRENVCVLDVRTREEYGAGHIAGARWAPGGQVVQATDEYVGVRAASVVLVCDGLVRSVMTASWLMRMGVPRVSVLAGGLAAWRAAGGAVEEGHAAVDVFGYAAARARVPAVAPGPLGDAVVLSVDASDVYQRRHVRGATWLCRSRLELRAPLIVPDRGAPVVVTCADGVQSTLAADTLRQMGYTGARVLAGGTTAWARAGQPVESGPGRMADQPDDVVFKPYDRGRSAMEAYLRWEEALDRQGRSPHALLPEAGPPPG